MKRWTLERRTPLLFLLPACAVIGAVVLYPALRVLVMSFTDYNMINPPQAVGWANYERLWADPLFWSALGNTALYLIVVVPVLVIAPALLAILVNRALPGLAFFRAALYLPVVTSLVISALVWKWLYAEQGLLNTVLLSTGLTDDPVRFLTEPDHALFSVMAVTVWSGLGYYMVIYLAGLQSIPSQLLEVAEVEGVSRRQQIQHIILPLLKPQMAVVAVMSGMASMKVFEEVYVMTQGGPLDSTKTLVFHLYESAFVDFDMGYAAAIGVVLFVLTLGLSLLNLRLLGRP
ncbi:MAG: sugar ABC transporter permease [Betaproteobacteria bacterium]|nr:sugar ABC transporter permease [Betaproteobacteria bacterium]NBT09518.1 sugar ABC transporter permease [Betaproteobacteria bacterium]NBU48616.1 sugar ABC transporter permease [Betaproteobacteria bacterium]NBX95919.1 sugar ABC transporter permease [Betaproteobacteria bacterium]